MVSGESSPLQSTSSHPSPPHLQVTEERAHTPDISGNSRTIKTDETSAVKEEVKEEIKEETSDDKEDETKMEEGHASPTDPDPSQEAWRPLRSRSFLTDAQVLSPGQSSSNQQSFQVTILQNHFKRNPFPSKYELSAVAEQIGVNKRVVQVSCCPPLLIPPWPEIDR